MSIARRTFAAADQTSFAELSGDRNPIHVDPVRARRTIAGRPAVHGIHLLLWALEAYAAGAGAPPSLAALDVQFTRFVLMGEEAELTAEPTEAGARLSVNAGGATRCEIRLAFGGPEAASDTSPEPGDWIDGPMEPLDMTPEEISGRTGRLRFAVPPRSVSVAFPAASAWLGARRLAALAATSRLVGMVYPGLHSIYTGLKFVVTEERSPQDGIAFTIARVRHRLVAADVRGAGLAGRIEALARAPPARQAGMADIVGRVAPDAFEGASALVVGGTRGLGELTAKLLTAGGARVTITYHVGREEADTVAAEIRFHGGACEVLHYEVGRSAAEQLAPLSEAPTHAYYFATPSIARPNATFFDRRRLAELEAIFVDGFWDLATALRDLRRDVALFYPSTIFVTERPKGMGEYAMAKAAGEILCAEMNATLAPLSVTARRLPRLFTDQTAGIAGADPFANIDALLPAIREVQAPR
jgi:acyl dehydratase